MENIPGAYLHQVVSEIGPLPLQIAKFYISSIVLALEYLHSKEVAFHNFKLDSFKVDKMGYLWVYDLSQAVFRSSKLCYLKNCSYDNLEHWKAPEVITQEDSFFFSPAFWGLGVLSDIIILGNYPFGKY